MTILPPPPGIVCLGLLNSKNQPVWVPVIWNVVGPTPVFPATGGPVPYGGSLIK